MKNFKGNYWTKILVIFSLCSFTNFLMNTNALAKMVEEQLEEDIFTPESQGDLNLGGAEALLKGENLPGDESSREELRRIQTASANTDSISTEVDKYISTYQPVTISRDDPFSTYTGQTYLLQGMTPPKVPADLAAPAGGTLNRKEEFLF